MAFYYLPPREFAYTTFLPQTFPEHHHLFEQTRHKIGNALSSWYHEDGPDIHRPRADVRETPRQFFMDVELPGVQHKEDIRFSWRNSRWLIIEYTVSRPDLRLDANQLADPQDVDSKQAKEDAEPSGKPIFHLSLSERRLGNHLRAFEFPVDVDHSSLKVHLEGGLLSIGVDKITERADQGPEHDK
jgi:HSP20 family molecular chaperone IbpA